MNNTASPLDEPTPLESHGEVEEIVVPGYFKFRNWFDRFIAVLLLIPGLPIMLCTTVLLILTSDGPVFYRQRRVGLNGKVFTLIKFRTMIQHAEKKTGPVWTSVNDPRITKVGKILRPTHIDELPQIFNVLLGEMMLIGPRPERPEFTCKLEKEIPGYNNRSLIRPGVTGLAQMNLPPDTDLESVRRKLTLDLEYIRTGCFKLDFQIFCATLLRMFCVPAKFCMNWTGVKREVVIPDYMYRSDSKSYIQRKLPQTYIDGMASQAFSSSKES